MTKLVTDRQRVVRFAFLPLMLIGVNSLGWWLASRDAPKPGIVALLLGAVGLSFLAERTLPYNDDWNEPRDDAGRDVAHALINEALQVGSLLTLPLMVDVAAIDGAWPSDLPFVLQVLGSVLVLDAGITLTHWASHRMELLWRFHAVHHSVRRFYGLNGLMKHPLHQLLETAVGTMPLVILGLPTDVATALVVAITIQLLLQHSNADYYVPSWARRLLALNLVHRFHHLKWPVVGDVNFGLFTNIWDRLLGTAVWNPSRTFTTDVLGIAKEPDYPDAYLAQLVRPVVGVRTGEPQPS